MTDSSWTGSILFGAILNHVESFHQRYALALAATGGDSQLIIFLAWLGLSWFWFQAKPGMILHSCVTATFVSHPFSFLPWCQCIRLDLDRVTVVPKN